VVVDTAFFAGNYPPEVSVEGAVVDGYPSPAELADVEWAPLVPRSPVKGDARNPFAVSQPRYVTHVRLCIYPDGGVARLRVHGTVVPDPRFLAVGAVDLAALENGGEVTGCSNMFYSAPRNLIAPGPARAMGEGWETARRPDDGNEYGEFRLAGPGVVWLAELDTSCFTGNAPGWAQLRGRLDATQEWRPLLPRRRLQPDTRHRFRLFGGLEVGQVRLDVYPDGGMARVRLWGELAERGREQLAARWFDLLPGVRAAQVLVEEAGLSADRAKAMVAARPVSGVGPLPDAIRRLGKRPGP
jgi:allantoicase